MLLWQDVDLEIYTEISRGGRIRWKSDRETNYQEAHFQRKYLRIGYDFWIPYQMENSKG